MAQLPSPASWSPGLLPKSNCSTGLNNLGEIPQSSRCVVQQVQAHAAGTPAYGLRRLDGWLGIILIGLWYILYMYMPLGWVGGWVR